MIPKKIHYCWFGGNPLPQDALMCIESWKKYFPDYEIIEWNEKNFDMNSCDYIREAAENKKWAFVSDFAIFKILYDFGGIYFDTDVEVVRNFDEIIAMGAFMGKEEPQDSTTYVINPGLGMAAEQGNGFCLDVIEYYKTIHFDFNNIITVCEHVTRCLKKKGYIGNNKIEKIDGFTLYPTEYFCPKNYYTNEMRMTRNTCSIHHYTSSWSSAKFTRFHVFETKIMKIFGPKVSDFFMVKLARNIYCNGLAVTVKKVLRLYKK